MIAVVLEGETALAAHAGTVMRLPSVPEPFGVLLTSVPAQLFGFQLATAKFVSAGSAQV